MAGLGVPETSPEQRPVADAALLEADFVVARRSFDVVARVRLAPGERLSLFGPSGAGKTTCLEAVAGTVALREGSVLLGGRLLNAAKAHGARARALAPRALEARQREVAFVRQPTTLFPHLSVAANIAYGIRRRQSVDGRSLEELLEHVGLGGLGRALPDSLSGGQRQRACLARALARPFRVLLLDEPFSAVDAASRSELRAIAAEATQSRGAVALLVTHDLSEAQAFAQRIGIMDDGKILQLGDTKQLVREPETTRVAELCGYRSFLPHASGRMWALHPDRFVLGAHYDRGVVVSGRVLSVQASGARFACEIGPVAQLLPGDGRATSSTHFLGKEAASPVVRLHLDTPLHVGESCQVTSLDPPLVSRVALAGVEEE